MATRAYSDAAGSPATQLGAHHLAYLRALAEGLPQRQAANLYLGHDPRDGAVALRRAHNATVDQVRALARRHGDPRWRLVGLTIRVHDNGAQPPSIDQWASERGLDGFSHAELLGLHAEAFPQDRRAQRNGRLRAQQLQLLQSLAQRAAETALPHHRLDAWFPEHLCRSLEASGLLLLSDLQARMQAGGRWWRTIPKIGAGKAARLAQQLERLMPGSTAPQRSSPLARRGASLAAAIDAPLEPWAPAAADAAAWPPDTGDRGDPGEVESAACDGQADAAAVRSWIDARSGSDATTKAYRRELARFLLFLEQRGRTLRGCGPDDCRAYVALLQNVPAAWSAKRTAPLGHEAWSPFAGPLGPRSQRQAVSVVRSCFAWLAAARYLPGDPWLLVARPPSPVHDGSACGRRSLSAQAWQAVCAGLERLARAAPAAERMLFLLQFGEATGLRAAELLQARLGHLLWRDGGLWLQVHGAGRRQRLIPIASQARRALARYLGSRGMTLEEALTSQAQAPLLASVTRPQAAVSYRSLHGSMKTWLDKAIDGSELSWADKVAASRASLHWLRHACGTRALERGVPLDVVGRLLGHADPRSTARYSQAQVLQVGNELERAFG